MKRFSKFFLLLVCLFLYGCVALLTPTVEKEVLNLEKGNYQLDPTHSSVLFKVKHLNLSTYVGRFNVMDASLDFDPESIESTRLTAFVRSDSVDVNNESLEETLNEEEWFNTKKFPQIILKTTSVERVVGEKIIFNADLSLRDVTLPIKLTTIFHGGADNLLTGKYTIGFSAVGRINRSQFGKIGRASCRERVYAPV